MHAHTQLSRYYTHNCRTDTNKAATRSDTPRSPPPTHTPGLLQPGSSSLASGSGRRCFGTESSVETVERGDQERVRHGKKAGPEGWRKGRTCAPPPHPSLQVQHKPSAGTRQGAHSATCKPVAAPLGAHLRSRSSTYRSPASALPLHLSPSLRVPSPVRTVSPMQSAPATKCSPQLAHSTEPTNPETYPHSHPTGLRGPLQTYVHNDKDPTKSPPVPQCLLQSLTHRPPRTKPQDSPAPPKTQTTSHLSWGDTGTPQSPAPSAPRTQLPRPGCAP